VSAGDRFAVVPLGDVAGYTGAGQPQWHMVRSELGIQAFGINAWRATEAGQQVIGVHDELSGGAGGHEEVYVVVSGRATFTVDGETVDGAPGTVVFVRDPAVKRAAVAEEPGTVVLVVGGKRGEAFSISPWELSSEALRYWTTEEWDRAIELLSRQHADDPANPNVVYNLACAESRAGRTDDAIAHLERAVALRPAFAESAPDDPDLEAIRDHPGFPRG
jgi:tetratricopeptide (TPR) repeat protein